MSGTIKLNQILGETSLYDNLGRPVGVYHPDTGRGMFAHAFFADERACKLTPREVPDGDSYMQQHGCTRIAYFCGCGFEFSMQQAEDYRYCPNCGCKVVEQ